MTFLWRSSTPWKSFSGRSRRHLHQARFLHARFFVSLVLIAKSAREDKRSFEFVEKELNKDGNVFCQAILLHELGKIIFEAKQSNIRKSAILAFENLAQGDLPSLWPLKFMEIIKSMISSENDIIRRRGDQEIVKKSAHEYKQKVTVLFKVTNLKCLHSRNNLSKDWYLFTVYFRDFCG